MGTLLADMVIPGGVTLADLENDHFMRGKPLDIITVALAITVIRWLEHLTANWSRVRQARLASLLPTSALGSSLRLRPGLCFARSCSGEAFAIFGWNHS